MAASKNPVLLPQLPLLCSIRSLFLLMNHLSLYCMESYHKNSQKCNVKIWGLVPDYQRAKRNDIMIQFKPVTKQDAGKLRKYYQDCQYGLCEYSVGTKLMWRNHLHPAWAESAGCLVVRNYIDGQTVFDYPVPGPEGDEDAALSAIEHYCMDQGISPVISVVPDCKAARLLSRYPYVCVSDIRTWRAVSYTHLRAHET